MKLMLMRRTKLLAFLDVIKPKKKFFILKRLNYIFFILINIV